MKLLECGLLATTTTVSASIYSFCFVLLFFDKKVTFLAIPKA